MADLLFGITDTGRVRTNNEDAFVAMRRKGGSRLAAVIDGVGGYEGGEVAAAIAQKRLAALAKNDVRDAHVLVDAFLQAEKEIVAAKEAQPALQDMACVLTAVITDESAGLFHYAHVGDTRLYLFRDGSLVKITHDHSFVGLLEDSGRISEDEAMAHPKRNEIDRALGFRSGIGDPATYIETGSSPFLPGDLLLLCSDGLSDLLTRGEMVLLMEQHKGLEDKGAALIAAANRKGGKDNITLVLVAHPEGRREAAPVGTPRATQTVAPAEPQGASARSQQPVAERHKPAPFWPWIVGGLLLALLFTWVAVRRPGWAPEEVVNEAASPSFGDVLARTRDTLRLKELEDSSGIKLPDSLLIEHDTLVLLGDRTRMGPAGGRSILQVAPTVRLLVLSKLELRETDIRISTSNLEALRFDSVRLRNVSIGVAQPLLIKDTLISGMLYLDKKKGGRHE